MKENLYFTELSAEEVNNINGGDTFLSHFGDFCGAIAGGFLKSISILADAPQTAIFK